MSRLLVSRSAPIVGLCACIALLARPAVAQAPTREMVDRGHRMLAQVHRDLRELYFDSTFGGLDIEARYRAADSAITIAPNNNYIVAAIAQFVSELDDSHTFFVPPGHVAKVDYGYSTSFVGDTCFITSVKAGSDAAAKGVKRGDALLKLDAFDIQRATYGTISYVYGALNPRPAVRLTVRSPEGAPRVVDVAAKITMRERTTDYTDLETVRRIFDDYEAHGVANHRWYELGDSVVVWRMSQFDGEDRQNIDDIMKKVRKSRGVVFDLRNDPGGVVATLEYIVGQFIDQPVTAGTMQSREGKKPWVIKPATNDPYRGMLVVLINSGSGSCSELFARLMQLEGRAVIVGDRSAGAVVTARRYQHTVGFERVLSYTFQVSTDDVVMSDGQRLEKVGVIPDHVVLPTGGDIAARRDPQLAKALSLVGVTVSPDVAGAMYRPSARQSSER